MLLANTFIGLINFQFSDLKFSFLKGLIFELACPHHVIVVTIAYFLLSLGMEAARDVPVKPRGSRQTPPDSCVEKHPWPLVIRNITLPGDNASTSRHNSPKCLDGNHSTQFSGTHTLSLGTYAFPPLNYTESKIVGTI